MNAAIAGSCGCLCLSHQEAGLHRYGIWRRIRFIATDNCCDNGRRTYYSAKQDTVTSGLFTAEGLGGNMFSSLEVAGAFELASIGFQI
jgi:hypothetical protein